MGEGWGRRGGIGGGGVGSASLNTISMLREQGSKVGAVVRALASY